MLEVPAGCLDLSLGGTLWAGRSSFSRCSSVMACELALLSPPFHKGRALGQGFFTMWILEISCGREIVDLRDERLSARLLSAGALRRDVEEHAPLGWF